MPADFLSIGRTWSSLRKESALFPKFGEAANFSSLIPNSGYRFEQNALDMILPFTLTIIL
jgi:hypothetical protein